MSKEPAVDVALCERLFELGPLPAFGPADRTNLHEQFRALLAERSAHLAIIAELVRLKEMVGAARLRVQSEVKFPWVVKLPLTDAEYDLFNKAVKLDAAFAVVDAKEIKL